MWTHSFDARFRNTCAFDIDVIMKAHLYRDPYPTRHHATPQGNLTPSLSPERAAGCVPMMNHFLRRAVWILYPLRVLAVYSIEAASYPLLHLHIMQDQWS